MMIRKNSAKTKEEKLLIYIKEYLAFNNYPPSVREMCKALGVNSTSTIAYYLDKLEKSNQIKKSGKKNRAIEIIRPKLYDLDEYLCNNMTTIPILGNITAGQPVLAVETKEEYFMAPPTLFRGDDLFILHVHGESMINAGIYDGDRVIIKKQPSAENGEIIAALVDDSATVKRFFKENGQYRLQPENDTMQPIIVDKVEVIGKVIGLIRKY